MVSVFLGPPGVGKGTQASRAAEAIGGVQVSTGDLLREARRAGTGLGKKAETFMVAGELVPDALILDMVREHLEELGGGVSIIFDGFPRTEPQAEALGPVLAELGREIGRVLLFEADDEVLIKRISGRRVAPSGRVYNIHYDPPSVEGVDDETGEPLEHRADDQPETVRRRLAVYRELTEPLIEFYQREGPAPIPVDADRGVDEIQTEVLGHLTSGVPRLSAEDA